MARTTLASQLREFLPKVYERYGPLNARQYAYQAEAEGMVEKRQFDYVNSILVELREDGVLPWGAVLDSSRKFDPRAVEAGEDADKEVGRYAKRLRELPSKFDLPKWQYQPVVPAIITEKAGLIPYFEMVTDRRAVSVYAEKGQAGKSHLHEVVFPWLMKLCAGGRTVKILYLGDVDDEGYQIPLTMLETIGRWAGGLPKFNVRDLYPRYPKDEVHHDGSVLEFERIALKPEHVERWGLSKDTVNPKSSIARKFVDFKCELEALRPDVLRSMIEKEIDMCWDGKAERKRVERVEELRGELEQKVRTLTKGWD